MICVPDGLWLKYDRQRALASVSPDVQVGYRKWLRCYLDFRHRCGHAYAAPESLPPFLAKLGSKGQGEAQCAEAARAVHLYFGMLRGNDRIWGTAYCFAFGSAKGAGRPRGAPLRSGGYHKQHAVPFFPDRAHGMPDLGTPGEGDFLPGILIRSLRPQLSMKCETAKHPPRDGLDMGWALLYSTDPSPRRIWGRDRC